jgi:S1-C subfamily serine protease
MALVPPFFLDCIVAIGLITDTGTQWNASGFLYGEFLETSGDKKRYEIYLVTNRHVVESKEKQLVLRFNPETETAAREFPINLKHDGFPIWLSHPDKEIDVAVIPINAQLLKHEGIKFNYFRSDEHVLNRKDAHKVGLTEGDGVFVLGFPMGFVGGSRNYPIIRQGAIARIRDTLAGSNKEFLVDTTIFPGNSGGPVVTKPEIVSIEGTKSYGSSKLLGIVQSYVPYRDVAVSMQTKTARIIFEENSGLASIVPIDFAIDIIREYQITKRDRATKSGALSNDKP